MDKTSEALDSQPSKACAACVVEQPSMRLAIWTSAIPDEGLLSHSEYYLCEKCFEEWHMRIKVLIYEMSPAVMIEGGDVE
jgi:hypothetical protein